jgi:geranylgeranyl reductase family protein
MQVWDVIVVGAGPAGCAAAYDLAAGGRSVLLLDKAAFPRSKACAGGLTMKTVQALRYSIAPVVRKTIDAIMLEPAAPGLALRVQRPKPVCVMTVRAELDAYCLAQTRARGAIFRQIGGIAGLREEADRVLVSVPGEGEPLAARLLLGADGVHSRVRALAGEAPWMRKGFALEANVPYSACGRRDFPLTFDFGPVAGGYGWLFPRDNHVNVGLYVAGANPVSPSGRLDRQRLTAYVAQRCGTSEHDPIVGQFLGLGAARYRPASGRILLAGDAAGFVDPLTGEGIFGAIASGQAAASAMVASLTRGVHAGQVYDGTLGRLRGDLEVAESAAAKFYAHPERGFGLMRLAPVRRAVLHAYSDGTSLAMLARGISAARRLLRSA